MSPKTPSGRETVRFGLFGRVSPHGEQLVSLWHDGAKENMIGGHEAPFLRFAQAWFAFNNWAMRVTEAETDREMIRALAESPTLQSLFLQVLAENQSFKNDVTALAQFWPIFDVKDIRKKGLRHKFYGLDRKTYTQEMLAAHVRHAPEGKFDPSKPTWDQTIHAIYKVRCNLFHGEKGDASEDADIVNGALLALVGFVDATGLYRRQHDRDDSIFLR